MKKREILRFQHFNNDSNQTNKRPWRPAFRLSTKYSQPSIRLIAKREKKRIVSLLSRFTFGAFVSMRWNWTAFRWRRIEHHYLCQCEWQTTFWNRTRFKWIEVIDALSLNFPFKIVFRFFVFFFRVIIYNVLSCLMHIVFTSNLIKASARISVLLLSTKSSIALWVYDKYM